MLSFARRFKIKNAYDVLREDERKKIDDAALEVMEHTGVRVHSAKARKYLKDAGAIVDPKSPDVRFPLDVVESLVKKVPTKIVLAGRTRDMDLPLDGTHNYYTTDGCGIQVWDSKKGMRRPSVLEDIRRTAILADYLPYVSVYEPMVVAHDVPQREHVVHGVKVAMENTTKHILTESTTTPDEAEAQVKMAAEVVGGVEELRKRHYISAMVCTMSPLVLDGSATDAALVWAKNHVPIHITGMAQMGISGPASIAGDLVVNHAETLALTCVIEACEPGAPVLYGSVLSSSDPMTGAYMGGSPESTLLCAAAVDMGKYCNMPTSTGGLGSSAKVPGTRASLENALSAAMCAVCGGEVVNGLGVLDGSTLLSYEQFLFDHEIAGMTIKIFGGCEIDEATLMVDLIDKVGIGGSYLSQRHTLENMKKFYMPLAWSDLATRSYLPDAEPDALKTAAEKAEKIISSHTPEPLDADISKSIEGIMKDFSRKGRGS